MTHSSQAFPLKPLWHLHVPEPRTPSSQSPWLPHGASRPPGQTETRMGGVKKHSSSWYQKRHNVPVHQTNCWHFDSSNTGLTIKLNRTFLPETLSHVLLLWQVKMSVMEKFNKIALRRKCSLPTQNQPEVFLEADIVTLTLWPNHTTALRSGFGPKENICWPEKSTLEDDFNLFWWPPEHSYSRTMQTKL